MSDDFLPESTPLPDEPLIWWVSFSDADGPRGVVITMDQERGDVAKLSERLWKAGLNPGGEMFGIITAASWHDPDDPDGWILDPANQERIIGNEELAERGYAPQKAPPK